MQLFCHIQSNNSPDRYFPEVSAMKAYPVRYLLSTMRALSSICLELHNDEHFQLHLNQSANLALMPLYN